MMSASIISALSVSGLRAGYGRGADIVRGIDFELPPESIVAVIGPNGSGKSSFVKTLAGLLDVRAGSVSVIGKDVTHETPARRVAAGLAYVPQEANVFPSLSIRENLKLATEFLRGRPGVGAEQQERVLGLFPEIANRMRTRAGDLSGGQRQMLAFASALLANPEVLLLDEPSAGLSPKIVDQTMEAITRVRESGVTVLLVEQNVAAALKIADEVVVLVAGRLTLRTEAKLVNHAELGELFSQRWHDMAAQLFFNGLVTGLLLALPALALTLVFGVLKFANFAVGSMMTLGAYAAWVANFHFKLSLITSAIIAAIVVALASALTNTLVFERLRDRGSIVLLVASMGVSLVIENICRFLFGNNAQGFDVPISPAVRWMGIRINNEQIATAVVVIICLVVLDVVLRLTPLGRAMRAVADNAALAAVRGVERRVIATLTWLIVGALMGLAGVLAGIDRAIDPLIGWNYQIPIFAAAILGGLGSPLGAVIGALVIGIAEEMSALVIPTNYRQAVSFTAILLLLLFRANGLLGAKAVRK